MSTWIEEHPEATRLERIKAMAHSLVGCATGPSGSTLEYYGLEEDFEIAEEPLETCHAFDAIVVRCVDCDWYVGADEPDEEGRCDSCHQEEE